jgi:alpha-ketoglutarate-dependent taurine dioxygenase
MTPLFIADEHRNEHVPTVWHSDVSYELNPPGITGLFLFSTPDSGGDTLFSDTEEHLRRLSPAFKELLKGLHAEHSGVEQAENAKQGGQGVVKRQPIITTHPVFFFIWGLSVDLTCASILSLAHFSRHGPRVNLRQQGLHQAHC